MSDQGSKDLPKSNLQDSENVRTAVDETRPFTVPWESRQPKEKHKEDRAGELDFFISYSVTDLETAMWIAQVLKAEGYSVSYQHQDFAPGGLFNRDIDERIQQARSVIAVVSPTSLESDWCLKEWDAAGDRLLPVRIEPVKLAGLLAIRTFTDLFGPGMGSDESRRKTLLRAVSGKQTAALDLKESGVSIALPPRCVPFVGRSDLLKEIYGHFFVSRARTSPRRLTLAGIGGTGKTALAIEYGHLMREEDEYSHVWFVAAENRETLETGLWQLLAELQVPRQSRTLAEQLKHALDGMREKGNHWLVVLDDAADLESVNDFLPALSAGHVLITSENPASWGRINVLSIAGWSVEEAIDFLMRETGTSDREAAQKLVEELDAHPERLIQAASYIDRTGTAITKYLHIYRDRQSQQHDRFAATLALALEKLAKNDLALDLLRFGSFLGPERIPIELLKEGMMLAGHPADDLQFNDAVQPLLQFSLAQRDDPNVKFSRLVQGQVRSSAKECDEANKWRETALVALDRLFPQINELDDPNVWQRAALLLPHVLVVAHEAREAKLAMATVGRLLCRAGHYVGGGAHFQGFTSASRQHSPPVYKQSSVDTSVTAATLLEDARQLLDTHARDPLDRSEVMAEIGELHRTNQRLDKAIAAFTEAYEIAVQATGKYSEISAMRLTELARVERDAGRVSLACEHLETAVRSAEEAGNEGQRSLSEAVASLGVARALQGRYPEAIESLKRAVELEEQIFGIDHIEVATTLDSLADAYANYGDRVATRNTIDRMIQIERNAYGERSAARCYGLSGAATHAIDADDPATAYALATEILELAGNEVVRDDQTMSSGYLLQAIADRQQHGKDWQFLLDQAGQALIKADLPNTQPRLTLVGFLVEDGHVRDAAELATQVTQERIAAGDWTSATEAVLMEASALTETGDLEQAEHGLRSLIETLKGTHDTDDSLTITLELELGNVLLSRDLKDESLDAYKAAFRLAQGQGLTLSQADARVAEGKVLLGTGRVKDGIDALQEGLELRRTNLIKGHPSVTEAQLAIARAEGVRGNEVEARKLLDAAVAATAERDGARSAEVSDLYIEVAGILAMMGRSLEANSRAEEAYRIRKSLAGDVNELLAATCDAGFCMLDVGNQDRARELASLARNLVQEAPKAKLIDKLRASELAAQVALLNKDTKAAGDIADQLVETLASNPDIPPRLKVSTLLLVADITPDQKRKLEAVNQARELNLDAITSTRREIALRAAELNWKLDNNEEAVALAEKILRDERDPSFRLDVLNVLVSAALDDSDGEKAIDLIPEITELIDKLGDPLRKIVQRLWVAELHWRVDDQESAFIALSTARHELQHVTDNLVEAGADHLAPLYERLADVLATFQMNEEEIGALEQAVDLYRTADEPEALANVMNRLARATLNTGATDASREWLKRVWNELPLLKSEDSAAVVLANVGLMYLDLGEAESARKTLEKALADWSRILDGDKPRLVYLLVPLIRACRLLNDTEAANRYANRAVDCSLLMDEEWDPDLLDVLLELAEDQSNNDEGFLGIVEHVRQLSKQRLVPYSQAQLLGQLAQIRAEEAGWDEVALKLVNDAKDRIDSDDDAPGVVLAEIAILKATALVECDMAADAVLTLIQAVATVRKSGDRQALVAIFARLGDYQLGTGDAEAAASTYLEASTILESLPGSLAERLQLLVSLAQAYLESGARSDGVRIYRQATMRAEAENPSVEVDTVAAMCRLAMGLMLDVGDRIRAGIVLERAKSLNARLLDSDPPQTEVKWLDYPGHTTSSNLGGQPEGVYR